MKGMEIFVFILLLCMAAVLLTYQVVWIVEAAS